MHGTLRFRYAGLESPQTPRSRRVRARTGVQASSAGRGGGHCELTSRAVVPGKTIQNYKAARDRCVIKQNKNICGAKKIICCIVLVLASSGRNLTAK